MSPSQGLGRAGTSKDPLATDPYDAIDKPRATSIRDSGEYATTLEVVMACSS